MGCVGEREPPSCQDAVANFYGAGCALYDGRTNPPSEYTQAQAQGICQDINAAVPDSCRGEFDDWKSCLDSINAPASNVQCGGCSQEMDALFACD